MKTTARRPFSRPPAAESNAMIGVLDGRPTFFDPPPIEMSDGRYLARFARNREEIDRILKLRFEVFNLEMGEGLTSSFATGRDLDEFDEFCHHLLVEDQETGVIAGTYRLQTGEMAARGRHGFYSSREFDLGGLPDDIVARSVELGRACISRRHRDTRLLFLLWRALAAFMSDTDKRYFFGCCSLTSQDPAEGDYVYQLLAAQGHTHPFYTVLPRSGFECVRGSDHVSTNAEIPTLFKVYLRYGAKVCSRPALDRDFKTIDFLVLLDVMDLDQESRRTFFGRGRP
jgi:putative hemolysin